jgi:hypothetical protein
LSEELCLVECNNLPFCSGCYEYQPCIDSNESFPWYPGNGEYCYADERECLNASCGPLPVSCEFFLGGSSSSSSSSSSFNRVPISSSSSLSSSSSS